MTAQPHVIVLGLGIVGSSIAATLSVRGYRVTGIEQFAPQHERGCSHGDTRLFRRVPGEGSVFVKLAAQSFEGWRRWNEAAHDELFVACGGVDAGPPGSEIVEATLLLCQQSGRPFGLLSGEALNRRYPHFNVPRDWQVVSQAESGYVRPDATLNFLHKSARESGAHLLFENRVAEIEPSASGITAYTEGESISGDMLVIAAGAWLPKIVPETASTLRVERRVTGWYRPSDSGGTGRWPVFAFDADGGWYGMPTPRGDLKIGHDEHFNEAADPDVAAHPPGNDDRTRLAACVERYLRGFQAAPASMKTCLYIIAAERAFIIDRHPDFSQVFILSCAGGGFKYAPVYGDIAADLIESRVSDELTEFRLTRPTPPSPARLEQP